MTLMSRCIAMVGTFDSAFTHMLFQIACGRNEHGLCPPTRDLWKCQPEAKAEYKRREERKAKEAKEEEEQRKRKKRADRKEEEEEHRGDEEGKFEKASKATEGSSRL